MRKRLSPSRSVTVKKKNTTRDRIYKRLLLSIKPIQLQNGRSIIGFLLLMARTRPIILSMEGENG